MYIYIYIYFSVSDNSRLKKPTVKFHRKTELDQK